MNNDLTEFLEFPKPAHCPRCGSARVAEIVWGLPTEEAIKEAEETDNIVFGGCSIDFSAPRLHCKACALEWGELIPSPKS
jgi:hypothetical protein